MAESNEQSTPTAEEEELSPMEEAFLVKVLMSRLQRGLAGASNQGDVEASLRQAGDAYRENVRPLRVDELMDAVRRLREDAPSG